MNQLQHILEQLQDTDAAADKINRLIDDNPNDEVLAVNADAIRKRRTDLARRLSTELRTTQSDLVQYHVERTEVDRYPVMAIAKAVVGFQELVTAVFDAIRSTPKQRYRPAPENIELSTLDFSMVLPVGSVVVSMSVGNERLLAVKSELDQTFERVFEILKTRDSEGLRILADEVGIASISKAHDWAASTAQFGLNTRIAIQKDLESSLDFEMSKVEAQSLKEAIEEKSDQKVEPEQIVGELFGIDVDPGNTYFHIKTLDHRDIEGRLAESFQTDREWAVHVIYTAQLLKVTTIKYATGEERIDWRLAILGPPPEATAGSSSASSPR